MFQPPPEKIWFSNQSGSRDQSFRYSIKPANGKGLLIFLVSLLAAVIGLNPVALKSLGLWPLGLLVGIAGLMTLIYGLIMRTDHRL